MAVAAFVIYIVWLEVQVRMVEEPNLVSVRGQTYRAYAHRVGRFVPGRGGLA